MIATSPAVGEYVSAFEALAPELPGHDAPWLRDVRAAAIRRFAEHGFPTPREEDWKYTNVQAIERRRFAPARRSGGSVGESDVDRFGWGAPRLVFVDGRFDAGLSTAGDAPGLEVESLDEALRADPDRLAAFLDRDASGAPSGFAALNLAFLGDGACIRVAAGATLAAPLHLLFVSTGQNDIACQPRILVEVGAGGAVTLVESYVTTGGGTYLTNATTEIVLGHGSRVDHYKVQQESIDAYHVAALEVRQGRDSRFASHCVSLGARLARQNIHARLEGEGAHCLLNGLYLADGRQHVDHHLHVDHAEPGGRSEEHYKGILDGRGRGVFNGRVYVHPGAQQSDAQQSNHNLLLSRNAEVDTKPQLEIYADDVKCSHGATVGQLDPVKMFYLRSRGVEEAEARGMLIHGFTRDVLDRMTLGPFRDYVEAALGERLPRSDPPGARP